MLEAELTAYLELARAFQIRSKIPDRDRALVLAGTCASLLKESVLANYCRKRVLQNNPGHMVGKWPNFEVALQQEDFQVFVKQLGKRFPLEKVEALQEELKVDLGISRKSFDSDYDYLAALLEVNPRWLQGGDDDDD